jgi:hypothetical protein
MSLTEPMRQSSFRSIYKALECEFSPTTTCLPLHLYSPRIVGGLQTVDGMLTVLGLAAQHASLIT